MVTNITKQADFYCMNGHKELVLMKPRERTDNNMDNFYACPKYMRKDEKHPDGHEEWEHGCVNRLSFSDAADILTKFNKTVEEDMMSGTICDYKGCRFIHKNNIEVTILKYQSGHVSFGILNRKAVNN